MIPSFLRPFVVFLVTLSLAAVNLLAQTKPILSQAALDGTSEASEFPGGMQWLNTANPLKLKDFRGKFVLLDFWTFCCINCMHVIPDLKKLEAKYGQELVVIGVHSAKFQNEKDTSQIREAILRYEVHHPVVNDKDFAIWSSYGVNAWPTLVLINPNGRIMGMVSGEGVFPLFDQALSEAIPYFDSKKLLKRSPLQLALEEANKANTLLQFPGKISTDPRTKRLIITDSNHHRILITSQAGQIEEVIGEGTEGAKDGSFEEAQFHHPQGTLLDGDLLYIADTENHTIRVANLKSRQVTTVLGTGKQAQRLNQSGKGTNVALNSPWDLALRDGKLYIAMAGSHQLWVADLSTWEAKPFAGSAREGIVDAPAANAQLAQPSGIVADGDHLYFVDSETSSVRKVDLSSGKVETIIGKGLFDFGDKDGGAGQARFQHPLGISVRDGLLYIADTYNSKIKVVDPQARTSKTWAGTGKKDLMEGKFNTAAFNEPGGLAWNGGKLFVADTNNHVIRVLDPEAKTVSLLEMSGLEKLSRAGTGNFKGRTIDLGQRSVKPGATSLAIDLKLPPGYKFSKDAPLFVNWKAADANSLSFGRKPADFNFSSVHFPVEVPVSKLSGDGRMTIDTVIYYCTEQSTACFVDPIRATVTLQSAAAAPATVSVAIEAKTPKTKLSATGPSE